MRVGSSNMRPGVDPSNDFRHQTVDGPASGKPPDEPFWHMVMILTSKARSPLGSDQTMRFTTLKQIVFYLMLHVHTNTPIPYANGGIPAPLYKKRVRIGRFGGYEGSARVDPKKEK